MKKNLYKLAQDTKKFLQKGLSTKTSLVALFSMFVVMSGVAQAQKSTTISGKIIDKQGALPGVSILEKGTTNGTRTDTDGKFTLQLSSETKVLTISHVGYFTKDVDVKNNSSIEITLEEDLKALSEVVVIGYGSLNKREVSSAITHLNAKDLLRVGGNNPLMAIQGKVAGLSITNTASADPNSSPSIQLRGASSRSAGLGPLFVVNGIPGGNIDNINQNEIESIDVLKGGAASAIYGTRGSNGVIVITTKKGSSESRLFYDSYATFDYLTNELSVLSKEQFLANKRGVDFGGNTNWMKEVSRAPSFSQKHTLQFSGGNGQTNYFTSLDFRDANGIDLRSAKREYGGRVNINHTSANNLIALTFSAAPRYAKTSGADYSGFNYALTLNPTLSVKDVAGKYNYITSGFFANNPVEVAKNVLADQEFKLLDFNGSAKLNILQNLNTSVTFGEVSSSYRNMNFTPSTITPVINGSGRNTASQSLDEYDQKSVEWLGNYFLDINKHSLKLLAGYSYQYFTASGFNASNEKFPSNVLTYNALGTGLWNLEKGINNVGSYRNSSTLIAFFGRLNYDFDQKYYLSVSLRKEGSSKFGYDNKWGYFPAASAAWHLTQENFLKGVSWLNELKLRADYGETGNQDFGNYLSLDTYGGYGYYPYNGTSYQVWGPSQNTNYNLRWEKAINFNAGVDFELFDNKISGSVNYYVRTNKDLLGSYNVPNPPNIQGSTFANVGTMRNTGVELQLSAAVVNKGDFSYNLSLTGAFNDNKFVSFSSDLFKGQTYIDVVGMPAPGSPGTIQRLQEDKRIGSFYALKSAGVNDKGVLLVYNKNGEIIPANQANNDDKQFVGNGLPKFTTGISNTFKYKNWDLSIFLRGAFGYKLFNTYAFYLGTPATQENANVLTSAYDGGKYSKLTSTSTYSSLSDYFLEPGGFLKVDNITLSYTQPLKLKYMKSARIYATTRNLATFTKYTGGDPDLVQVNGLYPGVNSSLNYYPSTTQLLLGLQLTF
ncbi:MULTISPECIES: SusC/RagA family TonB-linked outer membrane protein [unclassified Arcicella]|uniref:SusC/RagA family TonB-linked outer membrane protein n=1 Tax=unclassified Arcicella TaxID=2644986 RepID=UPI0028608071|nr:MULTISPECIES: SusC/RagA family TonB-linked outer membrane protein [unclassified Arcicella]MDR6562413.1 TonB-linked SusC/RagA family outer membrane protein [Arcicella sp. BE51]MDR6812307.1 TonB-linked SusC/RagA family outer membrane protein [Arcicella sp. BE140]MDR6823638.1 TonB-linked SusC/RagA family outer membrane protein [Arcicella sp. BE139]